MQEQIQQSSADEKKAIPAICYHASESLHLGEFVRTYKARSKSLLAFILENFFISLFLCTFILLLCFGIVHFLSGDEALKNSYRIIDFSIPAIVFMTFLQFLSFSKRDFRYCNSNIYLFQAGLVYIKGSYVSVARWDQMHVYETRLKVEHETSGSKKQFFLQHDGVCTIRCPDGRVFRFNRMTSDFEILATTIYDYLPFLTPCSSLLLLIMPYKLM